MRRPATGGEPCVHRDRQIHLALQKQIHQARITVHAAYAGTVPPPGRAAIGSKPRSSIRRAASVRFGICLSEKRVIVGGQFADEARVSLRVAAPHRSRLARGIATSKRVFGGCAPEQFTESAGRRFGDVRAGEVKPGPSCRCRTAGRDRSPSCRFRAATNAGSSRISRRARFNVAEARGHEDVLRLEPRSRGCA